MHRLAIVPRRQPEPSAAGLERIARLASGILAAEPRIGEVEPFGPNVRQGLGEGMAIFLGDAAEIRLLSVPGEVHHDYRLVWLARSGDTAVIGGPASAEFEDYQRQTLGEPGVRYLHVETERNGIRRPAPIVCLKEESVYRRLCGICSGQDDITLMPHISTGTIWGLAAQLARDTGARVNVAGSPPLLTRRVNDKLWFGDIVSRLLGAAAIPEKRSAFCGSALVRHVIDLGGKWDRLVLKVPDSAGSAGNVLVQMEELRGLRPGEVLAELRARVDTLGAGIPYPLAVEVWDANVLSSPSAQLWIPRPEDGPPLFEGIYEQILEGEQKAFAGAAMAMLPPDLEEAFSVQAMEIAVLFQKLGYFGRCSFDAILTGPSIEKARILWVECNGRWGGVSIPMSLVNRLPERDRFAAHVIVQEKGLEERPLRFAVARRIVEEYERERNGDIQLILLSPGVLEAGRGVHLLVRAATREAALETSREVMARLRAAGQIG